MMAVPRRISNLQLVTGLPRICRRVNGPWVTRSDTVVYVTDDNDRGISCFKEPEPQFSGLWVVRIQIIFTLSEIVFESIPGDQFAD